MATRDLPGSGTAARHGAGDADLTIMLAAHAALRRDLIQIARAAARQPRDPARRAAVLAGWETFKRQLHLHHTAEDTIVWPKLRERLSHSDHARSVLEEMEDEHKLIDPLLAAVDPAFGSRAGSADDEIAGAVGALADALTRHLTHEERDALPLIGVGLTAAEWRGVGVRIARASGLSAAGEMFAWLTDGASPEEATAVSGTLPAPARLIYRTVWKPRYARVSRW